MPPVYSTSPPNCATRNQNSRVREVELRTSQHRRSQLTFTEIGTRLTSRLASHIDRQQVKVEGPKTTQSLLDTLPDIVLKVHRLFSSIIMLS